jgi:glycerol-3-phosphate acyltransferase PlsY
MGEIPMSGGLTFLISYLIGSIPFAYIVGKIKRGVDLWEVGEGNIGARNVWHVVSPGWGVVVAILDASKGFFSGILALEVFHASPWIAGIGALLGHQFSIYLKGKGGKGAATLMGFLFLLYPLVVFLSAVIFVVLSLLTKNFHIAIAVAMGSIPVIWLPLFGNPLTDSVLTVCVMLIPGIKRIIDHRHMKEVRERGLFWTL